MDGEQVPETFPASPNKHEKPSKQPNMRSQPSPQTAKPHISIPVINKSIPQCPAL